MIVGMLWFCNDPKKSLQQKIQDAFDYYLKKYEKAPNLCLVNPSNYENVDINGLTVRSYRPVLPGHIWIGIEEKN